MNNQSTDTSAQKPKRKLLATVASAFNILLMLAGIIAIIQGLVGMSGEESIVFPIIKFNIGVVAIFTGWNNRRVLNPESAGQRPTAIFYLTNVLMLLLTVALLFAVMFTPSFSGLKPSSSDVVASVMAMLASLLTMLAAFLPLKKWEGKDRSATVTLVE